MPTEKQIQHLQTVLLSQKEVFQNQILHNEETTTKVSQKDSVEELSSYDNHPADLGTELFERERDMALCSHAKEQIEKINDALKAIENGSYGICKKTGKEIPYERLKAEPTAQYLVEHTPEDNTSPNRPVEEDVLIPATRDNFADRHLDNEINDYEDSFGKVARFGTSDTPSDYTGDYYSYDSLYDSEDETNGDTEEYESFIGNDIEGKNPKMYPNQDQKKYEAELDEENIESKLGDLPYKKSDGYVDK